MLADFFNDNWGWIVAGASGLSAAFIKNGIAFIKNKLSMDVASRIETSISNELGEENTAELKKIIKQYGVSKLVQLATEGFKKLEAKEARNAEMLKLIMSNHLALGVYDESPEIKAQAIKLLNE
jgi:polyhydroxyalkanoate synthesis regulator protein